MQSSRYRQVLKEVREGTTTAENSADVDDHDSEGCPGTVGGAAADALPGTPDAPVPVHHRPCPPPSTHPFPPSRPPDPHYAATDEGCHFARVGWNCRKGQHPAPGPVAGRQRAQIGRCTSSTGPADRPHTLLGGTCTSSAGPADSPHGLPSSSSSPGYIVYEPEVRSSLAAKRLQKGRLIFDLASSEDSGQEEDSVAEGAQAVPSEVAATSCEDGSGAGSPAAPLDHLAASVASGAVPSPRAQPLVGAATPHADRFFDPGEGAAAASLAAGAQPSGAAVPGELARNIGVHSCVLGSLDSPVGDSSSGTNPANTHDQQVTNENDATQGLVWELPYRYSSTIAPGRPRGPAIEASSSYVRWTDAQLRLLARAEVQLPPTIRNINQALVPLYSSRTFDAIKSCRRQERYRQILAEERQRDAIRDPSPPVTPDPSEYSDSTSDSDGCTHPVPILGDIERSLDKYNVVAPGLGRNLAEVPVSMSDITAIYDHFNVRLKTPSKGRKKVERLRRRQGESSRAFKRRLFKEHQRLYSMGPKVLLEDLIAGSGGLGPVSVEDIHQTFDPIFANSSPAVRRVGVRAGSLRADAPLFVEAEVAGALCCLQKSTAPGHDGLSVPELKKIPA
ncbi:hypothetical protein HPB48_022421 [Haemaphysalis longicornis]|uniref:Uncharacterized protein n=1 Tax=Haemaphysalis longicornis TaxID=44386 RepID=A0A9J6G9X7_HAELO|nr:hypothetical protein HPB48_022421 [Haemaphysalis longicornis]